jgi:hypothetical protein
MMNDKLRLLTVSEVRCYQACARKHHYQYDMLYRPVDTAESLRFGTLIHKALEVWWSTETGPLSAAILAIGNTESDPVDRVIAEELIRLYDSRWGAEPYEVLSVEQQFDTELINPETGSASRTFREGGKLDVLVRDMRDNRKLIVEHKTSSEDIQQGSEYWRRLQIDNQVSTYFVGARSLGHDVSACLYDVIGKPKIRPLEATPVESRKYTKDGRLYAAQRDENEPIETFRLRLREKLESEPSRWLQRGEVVRLDEDESDTAFDMWAVARQIRDGQLANRYPRNPSACSQYGRTCCYFGVCTGTVSLDDPIRFRRAASAHEELEQTGETGNAAE